MTVDMLTGMTLEKIDIKAAVADAERVLASDPSISASAKTVLSLLLLIIKLLIDKTGKNSSNSSIPPSQDPHRKRERKANGKLKPGGQPGRIGTTLLPVDNPDEIKTIKCSRRGLPPGTWKEVGYEKRQIFDLHLSRHVTEYRALLNMVTRSRRTPSICRYISCCPMNAPSRCSRSSTAFH